MKLELYDCYKTCEDEFKSLAITVKILIDNIREEVDEIGDKLRGINVDISK